MDARLLNMFHDAADNDLLTITDSIDVNFGSIIQETIQQHRRFI